MEGFENLSKSMFVVVPEVAGPLRHVVSKVCQHTLLTHFCEPHLEPHISLHSLSPSPLYLSSLRLQALVDIARHPFLPGGDDVRPPNNSPWATSCFSFKSRKPSQVWRPLYTFGSSPCSLLFPGGDDVRPP
jgi:hypothetical protein